MKPLRILGIAVGVLLILAVAAVGVLYAMFDGARVKSELTRAVQEKTRRTLAISGDLSLSLWPDVGIKAGRLTLSEPDGAGEFLALDSARVAVAVMPLLSRRVEVRAVEVQGLAATLVKKKDGSLNIADLLGEPDKEAGKASGKDANKDGAAKVGAGETAPLRIDVAGVRLGNARVVWRDERVGRSVAVSNLDLATGRVQADTGARTLAADAVRLAAKGQSGTDAFTLTLEAPKLALSPTQASGGDVTLGASLAGVGRKAALTLKLTGVEGNAQALSIARLGLDLDAQSGDTGIKGRLESPVAVNLAAQTLSLDKLVGRLDVVHPKMPAKSLALPIAGSLRADLAKSSADLRLATQFDESKIGLALRVPRFSPLALDVALDIDRLDIDRYRPPASSAKPAAGESTAAAAKPAAAEPRLDFSALKALGALQVSGNIRIGALQAKRIKIANLNTRLSVANGRLDLAPLALNLYGGAAQGSLSLNANGNVVSVKQNLTGVSIHPLLKDLADKNLLEGTGNVSLDVSTRGETVPALKKALAGTAALSLKDGAVKGINLAQTFRDLKAKLGARGGTAQDQTQQARAGEKTDFSELSATLKIANGVAHNEDLAMKSPFLRLAGAGDIDIGNDRMNYLAKASVVGSTAGQGGQDLEHLKGLTVPVRVTGPFEKLSYRIELGSLVGEAAKAKVEEKKQELKQKANEHVKDTLKGLFKK